MLVKLGKRYYIRNRERKAEFGGLRVKAPLMPLQGQGEGEKGSSVGDGVSAEMSTRQESQPTA